MERLCILQQNLQGAVHATSEFGQAMRRHGASIALLQEPYATDGVVRGMPGGVRVFTDVEGDSAIVVDDPDLYCELVDRARWGVCIRVDGGFGVMYVASIYCRYSLPLDDYLSYMDTVLLLAGSFPLILGLDANACSSMWFSKMAGNFTSRPNYNRGIMLSEWLVTNGVAVLNVPSDLYTFSGPRGDSDIDVTAANGAATTAFDFRWRVCDNAGVSDHNLIEIMATYQRRTGWTPPVQRRWRLRGIDWDNYIVQFRAVASALPISDFNLLTIDDQVSQIDSWMCAINDLVLGRVRKTRPRGVRWWTGELDEMRSSVKRLRRLYQRARRLGASNVALHKSNYLTALKTYKDRIMQVKEDEWRSFVRDNRDDPWGAVYRFFRARGRNADVGNLRVGNTTLSTWRDCTDALLGAFFPGDVVTALPRVNEDGGPPSLVRTEIEDSLCRVRSRKAPGVDGMTGEMCKSIFKAVPQHLESIFARCLSEGYFPEAWKRARVVVLLKSPGRERSNPRSYRGISLLPALAKVLERIMVTRLKECSGTALSEHQFGFREGRSVVDAWLHVRRCVSDSSAKYVLGIFVDFKGAFDYLRWGVVLDRLRSVGCRELSLWSSYFSGRKACVVGAGDTVWKDVVRGCPQGSICGPFIWNLMMDVLLRRLDGSYKLCAYADDLLILVEGQSRAVLERRGEEAMRIVNEWGDSVGVSVAADKTVAMLLKGSLAVDRRPPHIRSGDVSLRYETTVKYLGIMVSERMNFSVHFPYVRDKLRAVAGKMRRILRSDWGLSRRATRTIYGGLFVACATYGAPVWYERVMSVTGRAAILSCQRVAMLACMPVCRTVSTDALQVLLGVPPLDLMAVRYAIVHKVKKGLPLLAHDWLSAADVADGDIRRVKTLLMERVVSEWRTRWTNSDNGRVTYEFIRDADFVLRRPDFGFSLSLGFLLTGHGSLNAFLHQRGLSETQDCRCGEGPEDWRHVLTECRLYNDHRDLDGMGITRTGAGWDFSRALQTDRTKGRLGEFARTVFRLRRETLAEASLT